MSQENKTVKKPKKTDIKESVVKTISLIAWASFSTIIAQFIVILPLSLVFNRAALESPVLTTIYTALIYIVSAALVIFVPKLVNKNFTTNREELGLSGLPTFTDIGISILGIIATFIVAGVLISVLTIFPWFNATETQELGYSTQIVGVDRAVAFLALVVIAPFFEELVFRGWLYGKLKKYNSVPIAILLVSLLFGILHGQLNVGITVGVMSVIMCIERELTGTIYAGILTHMLKNGIAFCLLFLV